MVETIWRSSLQLRSSPIHPYQYSTAMLLQEQEFSFINTTTKRLLWASSY